MVSIVIPTYNRASSISRAIESVLAQTFADWELIIVDDGSTDDTENVVNEYLSDARIRYVDQVNSGGPAAPRNKGASMAQGEWLAFLDSDDEWRADKLEKQMAIATANGECLVYSNVEFVSHDNDLNEELFGVKTTPREGSVIEYLLADNFISTSTVLLPTRLFRELGGFDEKLNLLIGEDYELWLRLAGRLNFYFVAEPVVKYYRHSGQLTKKRFAVYANLLKLYFQMFVNIDRYEGLSRMKVFEGLFLRIKRLLSLY